MEKLQDEYGVEVNWRSFELRPAGSPPMPPAYRKRIEEMRPQLYAMAKEQYGLDLNMGPFGMDSRPALVGGKFAEEKGVGEAYHEAVFRAYWQEGRSIEDTAVLAEIAESVGLDREAFLAALKDPAYGTAVNADVEQAHDYGLSGVPALIFNKKYLVVGAQPYPTLAEVVTKIQAEVEGEEKDE